MSDLARLRDWLARFTYMPGWKVTAARHPFEGWWVVIEATVPDSRRPGEMTDLRINSAVPNYVTDAATFYDWLVWRLCRVATHEVREWAQVDGVPVSDPHDDLETVLLVPPREAHPADA